MATPNKSIFSDLSVAAVCDWGIVFSLCALIFVLPASIALVDTFAGIAILFYLVKKTNLIIIDWPLRTSSLNVLGRIRFIWNGFTPPVNVLNVPLQLLAGAFFISVLFSQYPALSLFAFFGKFIKCVFIYFSFLEAFNDKKRFRIFLIFFLASAFITALSGSVQHYTNRDFIKGHHFGYENSIPTGRVNSAFFSANGFGAYLLPVFGIVAHLLFTAVRRKSWILGGALALFLILLLTCLCWTYSRSAWVGYLFVLIVMAWMDYRKILYAIALSLVLIFIFLPSLNNVRHLHLINDNVEGVQRIEGVKSLLESGGSGRAAYWQKAVSIIRSSPIYGTGLNTYSKIIRRNPDTKTWWYAHNCYLQITAETGLIGLFCFLWMLYVLFRHSLNHSKQINERWSLAFFQGAVSGLFGFLIQSFFDNTFYTVQLSVLMWLIFGLIAALIRLNPAVEQ